MLCYALLDHITLHYHVLHYIVLCYNVALYYSVLNHLCDIILIILYQIMPYECYKSIRIENVYASSMLEGLANFSCLPVLALKAAWGSFAA